MSEACKGVLLIVEDEPLKRVTLRIELAEAGYQVLEAPDAPTALKFLSMQPVHVVISDLRLPGMDGLALLHRVKAESPQSHVIMMTAYGSVDGAVEAIKRGAYDYLTKPFKTEQLLEKLDRLRSCDRTKTSQGIESLGSLRARSYAAKRMLEQARKLAGSMLPVLIFGEPGSEAQALAEAIHQSGPHANRPMASYSCVASSGEMPFDDLFVAGGGTCHFMDIDALTHAQQARLLAHMDAKPGHAGDGDRGGAVRFLFSTTKDPRQLTEQGKLRQDFYYRISATTLDIPPLRNRRDDVPVLAESALHRLAAGHDGKMVAQRFSPQALDLLMTYHWPGNVCELEQVVQRACCVADSAEILPKDVLLPASPGPRHDLGGAGSSGLTDTVAGVERTLIVTALQRAAGNQAKAAQYLGIPRTTLRDKMAKYGMVGEGAGRASENPAEI